MTDRIECLVALLRRWQQAYNKMDGDGIDGSVFQALRRETHDALSTPLASHAGAEPVAEVIEAWINGSKTLQVQRTAMELPPAGTKLYAAPGAAIVAREQEAEAFLRQMASLPGTVIRSSRDLDSAAITDARASGKWLALRDGLGFAIMAEHARQAADDEIALPRADALAAAVREVLSRAEDGDSPTYLQPHEAKKLTAALATPPAAIPATPMCRDCADFGPICPNSGKPCTSLTAMPPKACEYCDDSGDVHGIDGEWRGICNCPAGDKLRTAAAIPAAPSEVDVESTRRAFEDAVRGIRGDRYALFRDGEVYVNPTVGLMWEAWKKALTQPTTVQQAEPLAELRRALAAVGVVGQIDGHDVVRRLSVLDVVDDRCRKGGA